MNKNLLKSEIIAHDETQDILAEALGMALSTLSAKINGHREFTHEEMAFIKSRYQLSDERFIEIFFADKVS